MGISKKPPRTYCGRIAMITRFSDQILLGIFSYVFFQKDCPCPLSNCEAKETQVPLTISSLLILLVNWPTKCFFNHINVLLYHARNFIIHGYNLWTQHIYYRSIKSINFFSRLHSKPCFLEPRACYYNSTVIMSNITAIFFLLFKRNKLYEVNHEYLILNLLKRIPCLRSSLSARPSTVRL